MKPIRTAAVLLALSIGLGLAGCGGDDVSSDEVPVNAPELTVPRDNPEDDPLASGADEDGGDTRTSTNEEDPDVKIEPSDGADSSGGGTSGSGSTGGGTAPPAATAAPPAATTAPNTGGASPPGQGGEATPAPNTGGADGGGDFEDFCNQNPGACP